MTETAAILTPTVAEIMETAGLSRKAAEQRLYRYRLGMTTYAALLAAKGEKPGSYRTTARYQRQVGQVMQRVAGITYDAARKRVDKYNNGEWTAERVFTEPVAALQQKRPTQKMARLDAIPGATRWERENLGEP